MLLGARLGLLEGARLGFDRERLGLLLGAGLGLLLGAGVGLLLGPL